MNFADRLRELAEKNDVKQIDLANYLNVAKTTINGYFRGVSEPDFIITKKIAEFFGVSVDYLLGFDNDDSKKIDISFVASEITNEELSSLLRVYSSCKPEDRILIRQLMSRIAELKNQK